MKQKHTTSKKEDAVSPIVGVMLMLVATIIVAAIVAAFAGGMAAEVDSSPNIIITGTYSQTDGLILKHVSGDSVSGVDIYVRPADGFSTSYHKLSWKSASIPENKVWSAGDIIEVKADKIQQETDGAPDSGDTKNNKHHDGTSTSYGFNVDKDGETAYGPYTAAIGKSMTVEVHKDGRIIASTTVKIMG